MLSQVAFSIRTASEILGLDNYTLSRYIKKCEKEQQNAPLDPGVNQQLLVAVGYITQKRCLMRNRSKRLFHIYRKVHNGILALLPLSAKRCQV